ncbi:hypothetical protein HKK55_26525 [Pseudomonas sp. ADAK18]|nr:hypothetical protein [Pseudomonas sp. ADAK18]QJI32103.1 hypothetical protein HKK55_26525 [Pseudomonas sp. ADAK18]
MTKRWFFIWLLMGWLLAGSCSEGGEDLPDSESTPVWWKAGRQVYA